MCTLNMVQDNAVVENCCNSCDSHHAYTQVVMIPLPTITCFGDVSFLNIILYVLCVPTGHHHAVPSSVVPANTHDLLA